MNSWTDSQLLREYAERRSEAAFAELVRRHLDLVYSAALRLVSDSHLAQDVSQGVFLALAQEAGDLTRHPLLSGWLHRTTRNIASNAVRSGIRRQACEQEAAAMNQLLCGESDVPWDRIAPQLDTALGELNEGERHALLLRYFERKSAKEIAQVLAISDDAAQKRVSRAVDRLRVLLAKRGVAVGASGLVILLSANAIQAAPAALAGTILSTISAGAALHTASAAAIKAITMTTMQKALVAALVVSVVGAGIYQGHRLSLRAAEARTLSQEQKALAEQVQGLERERDEATNLLAAAKEDNARLKSGQMQAELLRLRGQAGALRQELATNGAGPYPNVMSRLAQDPGMRRQTREEMRRWGQFTYGPLFKELKLTPKQTDQAIELCGDWGLKMVETFAAVTPGTLSQAELAQIEDDGFSGFCRQLQPLLGEPGVARFKEIRDAQPAQTTVALLNGQLGANQLSDEQATRLVQIVKAEPLDLTEGIVTGGDKAFWGTPQDIQDHLSNIEHSNQRVLQQASGFLSPEQLSALSTVLSNGISSRNAFAAAYVQKH